MNLLNSQSRTRYDYAQSNVAQINMDDTRQSPIISILTCAITRQRVVALQLSQQPGFVAASADPTDRARGIRPAANPANRARGIRSTTNPANRARGITSANPANRAGGIRASSTWHDITSSQNMLSNR